MVWTGLVFVLTELRVYFPVCSGFSVSHLPIHAWDPKVAPWVLGTQRSQIPDFVVYEPTGLRRTKIQTCAGGSLLISQMKSVSTAEWLWLSWDYSFLLPDPQGHIYIGCLPGPSCFQFSWPPVWGRGRMSPCLLLLLRNCQRSDSCWVTWGTKLGRGQ